MSLGDRGESVSNVEAALLAYDTALQRGEVSGSEALGPVELDPTSIAQLRAQQRCLLELEELWPRMPGSFSLPHHREALEGSSRLAAGRHHDTVARAGVSSIDQLKQIVERSGIVSREDLEQALSDLTPMRQPQSVQHLVYELIQRQILNGDQAYALFRGELPQLALGPFLVVEELGRGGMGIVYRALDRRHQRHVALKMLYDHEAAASEQLKHEFRALSHLVHPNLVVLDELHAIDSRWFFTMELIEGQRLTTYARGSEPKGLTVGPDCIRPLFAQLASGLSAIHDAGKLHRDIKPSNALVTGEGRVVLIDFGLAVEQKIESHESDPAGTLAYMSPEQYDGQALSPESDWYSVGVMLYEALTGMRPFQGECDQVAVAKRCCCPSLPSDGLPAELADIGDLCLRLLHPDPAKRPSRNEIMQKLGGTPAICSAAWLDYVRVPEAEFVGRTEELAQLRQAWADVRPGRPGSLYVTGVSGIGKTALVQHFLNRHQTLENLVVLRGRCYERESVPYKALDGIVNALAAYLRNIPSAEVDVLLPDQSACLVRMFPALKQVGAIRQRAESEVTPPAQGEMRHQATASLRQLLVRLCSYKRVILFVDDLQWGDIDSAELLNDLLSGASAPGLLLLGCHRGHGQQENPCLRLLLGTDDAFASADRRQLTLGPLGSDCCHRLVVSLLKPAFGEMTVDIAQLSRESEGNPYFLTQLTWQAQRQLAESSVTIGASRLDLASAVVHRINELPQPARRLLEVVSIAGHPLRLADACRAVGLDPHPRVAALLRNGHFTRTSAGSDLDEVEPFHDRVRDVVTSQLSGAQQRSYHGQLAAALEMATAVDPEVLFTHFEAAGQTDKAARYALRAADQAAGALAFERAAELYRYVLAQSPVDSCEERQILIKLADALSSAGRGREAAEHYIRAAELTDGVEFIELKRRAANQYLRAGHVDEGARLLRQALAAVGLRWPVTRFGAFCAIVWDTMVVHWLRRKFHERPRKGISAKELLKLDVCWSSNDLAWYETLRGFRFTLKYIHLALLSGEPGHAARAMGFFAFTLLYRGVRDVQTVMQAFHQPDRLARETGDPYANGFLSLLKGGAWSFLGHWSRGIELSDDAAAIFRESCTGTHLETSVTGYTVLICLFFGGHVSELHRRVAEMLAELRHRQDAFSSVISRSFFGNLTWLAADEPDEARRQAKLAVAMWPGSCFYQQHMMELIGSLQIDLYTGCGAHAWRRIRGAMPKCRRSLQLQNPVYRVTTYYLRACAALAALHGGQHDRKLLRTARRDARRLEREGWIWSMPLARLIQAGVAARQKRPQQTVEHLRDAIDRLDAAEMALYAAAARMRLGQLLGGEEGSRLTAMGRQFMDSQSIRSPEHMTRMLVPPCGGR